jgi:hypothetical protein
MKLRVLITIFVTVFMVSVSAVIASAYDHEVTAKKMSFSWKIDGDTLHGKMSAKTKGWVAVGFNPSKKMKDANFIIAYVKGKDVSISDHFGDKATGHSADKKKGGTEDVTLVSGAEENGFTTIEFAIPLNSADKMDSPLSVDGETMLLLAYGPDRDSFKARHKFRTSMSVNLSTGATK